MQLLTARLCGLVLAGALTLTTTAAGQNNASATVTATVQQPVTVTKANDLSFGNVFPGLNKTIATADAGAANFVVAGQASTPVNLTFSLPTTLSSSGNTMPVNSWTGVHNTTASPTGGSAFTPSATPTSATLHTNGSLYLYVGATAAPGSTQAAGTYSGTMTLTVVYF